MTSNTISPTPLPDLPYYDTALRLGAPDGVGCVLHMDSFGDAQVTTSLITSKGNGTAANPLPTKGGDYIGYWLGQGWGPNGVRSTTRVSIAFEAEGDGDWSATSQPASMSFFTTPPGSVTPVKRFEINDNGEWIVDDVGMGVTGNFPTGAGQTLHFKRGILVLVT